MNNSSPFAREGYPFIAYAVGLTVLLSVASWRLCSAVLIIPAALSLLLTLFVLYFFRNPERTAPADRTAVIAPADGTVIVVECVPETPLGVSGTRSTTMTVPSAGAMTAALSAGAVLSGLRKK